ncbi:hypothetical protein KFL_002720130 [Klebsormidium nitens]|uniref:Poly [ADP-ribose] polymerase n=1 Tax=Klebsormidium nitens TaxID=105231 RepID=A0A1Y1I9P2_KLENI|nr:hypothetical protein KFL_002720130 [Klebsormidium nitens]|eukprot:GAQ86139.1 hypothetical protein KFL_002720130 [Klebsormidium nitens]
MGPQTAMQSVFIDLDSDEEAEASSAHEASDDGAQQAEFNVASEQDEEVLVLDYEQYMEQQQQKLNAVTIEQNKHALATVTNTFASIEARMKRAQDTAKSLHSHRGRSADYSAGTARTPLIPAAEAAEPITKSRKQKAVKERVRDAQTLASGTVGSPPAPAAERNNNGPTEQRNTGAAATVKSGRGTGNEKRKKRKRKATDDDDWLPGDEGNSEAEPDAHPAEKRTTRAKARARAGPPAARGDEAGARAEEPGMRGEKTIAGTKQPAAQKVRADEGKAAPKRKKRTTKQRDPSKSVSGLTALRASIQAAIAAGIAQGMGLTPPAAPPRAKGRAAAAGAKAPARKAAAIPVPIPHQPVRTGPSEKAVLAATKKMFGALDKRVAFLPKSDSDHKKVMALLANTGVPIVAIHKVLNGPARLAAFEEEARTLAQVRPSGANVQQCWHGTSEDALLSILKTGFTASRTVHGKSHGNGLYMAPGNQAGTSMGYARAGASGVSHMFLLRVILGGVEQGQAGTDLPSNPDLYDSAANYVQSPSEIIVWTPYLYSRILIEYVISFRPRVGI